MHWIFLKIDLRKNLKNFHLLKDFSESLALSNIIGHFLAVNFIKFGHNSDSNNKANLGCQKFKKLFIATSWSIGTYWWTIWLFLIGLGTIRNNQQNS